MSFPKLLLILAVTLFTVIGIAAAIKSWRNSAPKHEATTEVASIDVHLDSYEDDVAPEQTEHTPVFSPAPAPANPDAPLPQADRIREFFNKSEPKFPIVLTVTYKSRVPWQKGRPAWLSDYASHYATSRHFIARSLNGKADYFKQDVGEGDRFNVLNPDKNINFYLVIDTSRCKMWFYYLDLDSHERVLVKTYDVSLGRIDSKKASGLLTPLGKYTLGSKIAIYKPKLTGFYNGQKIEMIRVFGTRWIPFDKEIGECTAAPDGLGLHGLPWLPNEKGELTENRDSLGKYESDGCIRLSTAGIEELFAIIITRPTTVELVKDFYDAKLPGVEH
ncbi:MAG: L,D-transpeptidase [Parachlamydiaceae bacterium]